MERELDEAANRTAYFLAVHSGKPGFVLKTEHLKTSADTALYCSTQHLNGHSVLQLFDGHADHHFAHDYAHWTSPRTEFDHSRGSRVEIPCAK